MTDKVIVYTTCADGVEAEKLARHLIDLRLAACVNVIPAVVSYYRWKGKIENSGEAVLMIKTARALVDTVRAALEKAHSYELPELLAVPIVDGSPNYLAWLENEIAGPPDAGQDNG
jgi:periplasmic divalent cation tolerance protein